MKQLIDNQVYCEHLKKTYRPNGQNFDYVTCGAQAEEVKKANEDKGCDLKPTLVT